MKKPYVAGAALTVLLLTVITGVAPAGAAGTDASSSMTFWNVANEGFIHPAYLGAVLTKLSYGVQITNIPAGGNTGFVTPLTLPADVNKNSCSIKKVYLYWNAPATCQISYIEVHTAGQMLYFAAPGVSGTGLDQPVTIDLGGEYNVPRGLSVFWRISNTGGDTAGCTIYGYGTKVKYKV